MSLATWSWILTGIGVGTLYLVSRGYVWAWIACVLAQIPWMVYAVVSDQPGFILSSVLYMVVFSLNYRRARKTP